MDRGYGLSQLLLSDQSLTTSIVRNMFIYLKHSLKLEGVHLSIDSYSVHMNADAYNI